MKLNVSDSLDSNYLEESGITWHRLGVGAFSFSFFACFIRDVRLSVLGLGEERGSKG